MIFQTVLNSYIATIDDICTGTLYLGNGQVVFIAYINLKKNLIATLSLNFITFDNNLLIGISGFETDTYTKCMTSFICMGTKPT